MGAWVANSRVKNKNVLLTKKQIEDLDNLNFVWDVVELDKFHELSDYYVKNGYTNVIKTNTDFSKSSKLHAGEMNACPERVNCYASSGIKWCPNFPPPHHHRQR